MKLVKQEQLEAVLREYLENLGYELVALQWVPERGGRTLRILIDHSGGITIDDCGRISHEVGDLLEEDKWGLGSYRLEVSSPGVERPLLRPEDYRRFIGRKVFVKTRQAIAGRRNYRGRLVDMEDKNIIIDVDGFKHEVPFETILKAHLVYEGKY